MGKRNAPAIRFKGFTDDWEQRKLGEICSLITKGTTPKNKSGEGEVNFIKVENINSDNGEISSMTKISIEEHEGYLKRSQLQENDILFSIAGTLGRVSVIKSSVLPANTNQALAIIRTKEGIIKYIATVFNGRAVEEYIRKNPTVGAQPNLSLEQVGNLEIPYPGFDEQEKIGSLFCSLDNLITLHQRKQEKLKLFKEAMLDKMFPQNGKKIPEIRLNGFTGDWEQRKLFELGTLKNGMNFSKDAMDKGYPFVNLQNIFGKNVIDIDNLGKAEASQQQLKEYSLLKGDVLFVRSSVKLEGVGEAALVPQTLENTTYSGFIIRFRDEYGMDNDFKKFVFSIKSVRNQIISQATDSANKNVSQTVLGNLDILLPRIEEQEKIGAYFSNLDNLITLHRRKYEKLKRFKEAMLDKMFI